ncbi:MAG: adenylate/guanylate cyclase domain-containing protein [bacterium]|nr:adenylate/guanylate cyclase domain-containing protein [bacterium]
MVELLNGLFSRFKHLAERHGVEKIKTIGGSYMAAAGLPVETEDRAGAIAELALDMLQVVEEFESSWPNLRIRVGINTGPVVAGVIGTKKFIYDLWGETVNIASRMESPGKPGQIQVSEYSYDPLKDRYEFQKRGTLISKKKKEIHTTYFMLGRKNPVPLIGGESR